MVHYYTLKRREGCSFCLFKMSIIGTAHSCQFFPIHCAAPPFHSNLHFLKASIFVYIDNSFGSLRLVLVICAFNIISDILFFFWCFFLFYILKEGLFPSNGMGLVAEVEKSELRGEGGGELNQADSTDRNQ